MSTSHTSIQVEIQDPLDVKIGNRIRIKNYSDFLAAEFPGTSILGYREKADVHIHVSPSSPEILVININVNGKEGFRMHSVLIRSGEISISKSVYDEVAKTNKEERVSLENWENPCDAILKKHNQV